MRLTIWHVISGVIGAAAALCSVFYFGYEMGKENARPKLTESQSACANNNNVVIYSVKQEHDHRGIELRKLLTENGCKAVGPLYHSAQVSLSQPNLRYFHQSDMQDATLVAEFLSTRTGIVLAVRNIAEFESRVPKGKFELWLN